MKTFQMSEWSGKFGREYTDRNALSMEKMEALYKRDFGLTRFELNEKFLASVDRSAHILEVGANIGTQLLCLQSMGFTNLYGIELQRYAVELCKSRTNNIKIIEGSAYDLPFKDSSFDLIFTSRCLIHIHPFDITQVLAEIYRCTKALIWGLEYYADEYIEVIYRGRGNLLWKTDFARLYLGLFDTLKLIKEKRLRYLTNDNSDSMFLLRKSGS